MDSVNKSQQPLVSIIIPVYNSEKFLVACINSALQQTWPHKEIIIVDDGSPDGSLQVISQFDNPEIKIIQQQNQGASAARNRGMREAKGDYIQFLDADDLLSADKIEKQVQALQDQPGKLAICSTIHFSGDAPQNEQPSVYEEQFLFSDDNPAHFLTKLWGGYSMHGSMITVHAWLIPVEVAKKAGDWNVSLTVDDDGEYFSRVVINSAGIIKTSGFSYYRKYINTASLSSGNNQTGLQSALKAALLKKELLLDYTDSYEANLAVYKLLLNIAIAAYGKYPQVYKDAANALPKINPGSYKPPLGGKLSSFLVSVLGWRAVRKLQIIFSSISK